MSTGSPTYAGRKRGRPEEWGDMEPSPVIHIRGLPRHTLERDLVRTFEVFGRIRDITMMPQKSQALIQFEDIASAEAAVARSDEVRVLNHLVQPSFSTSKRIVTRAANRAPPDEQDEMTTDNHILLFTIYDADRPITVDVIHRITCRYGHVLRIVIFRKGQVQAMVEFGNIEEARQAKLHLNGADLFPGRCTLKVDYARPTRLTVTRNDHDNWDYEKCEPPQPCPQYEQPYYQNSLLSHMDGDYGYGHYQDQPYEYGDGYVDPYPNEYYRPPPTPHGMSIMNGSDDRGRNWVPTPVVMLYNIDTNRMNCDRIFNLLCVYGNVMRVKFLRTKEGAAMVEMGDIESASRVITNLSGIPFMDSQLVIRTSKQDLIRDVPQPYQLPDKSPSFKDYSNDRNNRYLTAAMAKKNRIYLPSRTLHYWNAPPNLSGDEMGDFLVNCGAVRPQSVIPFTKGSEKSSSGTIQWAKETDAFAALAICNHQAIKNPEHPSPFILKLAFASPVFDRSLSSADRDREYKNGSGDE